MTDAPEQLKPKAPAHPDSKLDFPTIMGGPADRKELPSTADKPVEKEPPAGPTLGAVDRSPSFSDLSEASKPGIQAAQQTINRDFLTPTISGLDSSADGATAGASTSHMGPADQGDRLAARNDHIESRQIAQGWLQTKGNVSPEFADKVVDGLANLPPGDLKTLIDKGVSVTAVGQPSDIFPHANDKFFGTYNLNSLAGVTIGKNVNVFEHFKLGNQQVTATEPDEINFTTAHEVGHAVDLASNLASASSAFKTAFNSDVKTMGPATANKDELHKYFTNSKTGPLETFANLYAMEHANLPLEASQSFLQKFPKSAKVAEHAFEQFGT